MNIKEIIMKVLKFRFIITAVTCVALLISAIATTQVPIESDLYSYMPDDIESIEAADLVMSEFDDISTFQLLFRDTDIETIDEFILELDKLVYQDKELVQSMRQVEVLDNGVDFLYELTINDELDLDIDEALEAYELIVDVYKTENMEGGVVSGSITLPTIVDGLVVMSIVIVITMLLVMVLFTPSFIEPLILLTSIGIAVVLNMGTNIIFPNGVSNVTFSIASLLQFAVSIDYSLILLGNYKKTKRENSDIDEAISSAVQMSVKPILTGAVTTMAGFLALAFMQFEIGKDMGFVLAKGVLFSLLVTLFILPIIIKYTDKLHEKFSHKDFLPTFESIGNSVHKIASPMLVVLLFSLGVFGLYNKTTMDYIYGEPPLDEAGIYIQENFHQDNILLVLFETDEVTDEQKQAFIAGLSDIDGLVTEDLASGLFTYMDTGKAYELGYGLAVSEATALVDACIAGAVLDECTEITTLVDAVNGGYMTSAEAGQSMIDGDQATLNLIKAGADAEFISTSGEIERIIIYVNDEENLFESEEIFQTVIDLRELADETIGEGKTLMTGESAVLYDMSIITDKDNTVVMILSILGVALVLLVMFKSLSIPVILILTIQSAILISLSLSIFSGSTLSYLGVVIVSAIQLGATIDYTVVLTEKYEHARYDEGLDKKDAVRYAIGHSSHALLTSGLALTAMGFIQSIFAIGTIAELGLLLGRGGLVSLIVSLLVMPHILYTFDRIIIKRNKIK